MNRTATRFVSFGAGLLALVTLGWILTGYAKPAEQEMPYHEGVPTDWSHNQVIFSRPATDDDARELGKEPRYWQQLYRRELQRNINDPAKEISPQVEEAARSAKKGGLWAEDLGAGAAPGAGNFPAKFGFSLTTANCASATTPDYVVYSTGLQGSGAQASIVAYDNIYSSCTGKVPTTYWSYNTGGAILTSPVISFDGSQVAFVQTSGSLAALLLVKWKSSATETVTSPGVPTAVSNANYRACVAPCMTTIFLVNSSGVEFDDRTSSLFYDFASDTGWVGGVTGWLVKLTGLFKGTPTEVTTGGFPVHVNPSNPAALYNPVYDSKSGNVFVGDAGGFLYSVNSTTGAVIKSAQVDFGAGLVSGPLLDFTNKLLYVFASSDGTASCTGGTACAAVYVFPTTFTAGSKGTEATVGQSVVKGAATNPNPLYIGGLDSAYYDTVGGTGNMYVCGNTGAAPILYRLPVTAGVLGTALRVSGLAPGSSTPPACSPVTDVPNPHSNVSKEEMIFFSTPTLGITCANKGCLGNFVSLPWQPKTAYTVGQEVLVLNKTANALYIQTAITAGTSGATVPTWQTGLGFKTTDGTVTWVNQGTTVVILPGGWTKNVFLGAQNRITDGTNIQIVVGAGTTGATAPTWNTTPGGQTKDNTVTWINAGPWPSTSITLTGGTGGVIIDNTVTSAGGSQIYFFTLGNNTCSTSGGTGSCAMQASQSSLN